MYIYIYIIYLPENPNKLSVLYVNTYIYIYIDIHIYIYRGVVWVMSLGIYCVCLQSYSRSMKPFGLKARGACL